MIIEKKGVSTLSQNLIHFVIRCLREKIWVLQLNIADYEKKYNSILCGVGKKLNFSRRVWCEQYELKKSTSHTTRDESSILTACFVNHIFHDTDT